MSYVEKFELIKNDYEQNRDELIEILKKMHEICIECPPTDLITVFELPKFKEDFWIEYFEKKDKNTLSVTIGYSTCQETDYETVLIPEHILSAYFEEPPSDFENIVKHYRTKLVKDAEERRDSERERRKLISQKYDKELLRTTILRAKKTYGEEFVIQSMKELYTMKE